jgi:hypothetical protein
MPAETFINPGNVILVSLKNNNMATYSFSTDQGWRVTEYRPFSPSYAVMHTPGLKDEMKSAYSTVTYTNSETSDATPAADASGDLLKNLTSQQLKFDYFSADVLKQLLNERVTIRDKNCSAIQSRLADVSGDIYGACILKTPDGDKRRQGLERTKMDLEKQLRDEDVTLWRDALEIRRELILASKKCAGSQFRQGLMSAMPSLDDNKGQTNTGLPE